jgi:hypothetical protein
MKKTYGIALGVLLSLSQCVNPDTEAPQDPYQKGIWVLNQGNVAVANGGISFVPLLGITPGNPVQDAFRTENNRDLLDLAQSIAQVGDRAYVVANNRLEVVNFNNFKSVANIPSRIELGRFFAPVSATKGYVSCWGRTSAFVAVIDLATNSLTRTLPTANGPEDIEVIGNEAFVALSGGSGTDNRLAVFDTQTDTFKQHISVGDAPIALATDVQNKLWVLCRGRLGLATNLNDLGSRAELIRINPATKVIEARFPVGNLSRTKPSNLLINAAKNTLYFSLGNGIFEFKITDTNIPASTPFIRRSFPALALNPSNNWMYGASAVAPSNVSYIFRYRATGEFVDSIRVGGINPVGFLFK